MDGLILCTCIYINSTRSIIRHANFMLMHDRYMHAVFHVQIKSKARLHVVTGEMEPLVASTDS